MPTTVCPELMSVSSLLPSFLASSTYPLLYANLPQHVCSGLYSISMFNDFRSLTTFIAVKGYIWSMMQETKSSTVMLMIFCNDKVSKRKVS